MEASIFIAGRILRMDRVTVHTVSCTCCTASGQFSDGAGIQPLAVRRLFNGLDALQFAAGWAVNCNWIGLPHRRNYFYKKRSECNVEHFQRV